MFKKFDMLIIASGAGLLSVDANHTITSKLQDLTFNLDKKFFFSLWMPETGYFLNEINRNRSKLVK